MGKNSLDFSQVVSLTGASYVDFLPEASDVFLVQLLTENDKLRLLALEARDVKLYTSLVNTRVDLLAHAGLTPKSRRQMGGETPKTDPDERSIKNFLVGKD